jgi:hypothetical protein
VPAPSLVDHVLAGTFDPAVHASLLGTDASLLELELCGRRVGEGRRLVMLGAVQIAYGKTKTARARRALLAEFAAQAERLAEGAVIDPPRNT